MPILKFYGLTEKEIIKYSKKTNELALLIQAKPNAISYVYIPSTILSPESDKEKVYIEINWICRKIELREKMVNHIEDNFKHLNKIISIKFTDINRDFYVEGQVFG
ncbi:DUF1904 family protein [Mesoplasma corruscae]|uniref:DUF1904 domain-containing protein n=1 Tax=Mesoplasma corruscae TaxID=216874 RepID=A0A2S5RH39_9MOLU|nr:DUF1904 family protein [Mesoplasma corruscae]PPE06654.1 hypothetical protein MCORR_v1c02850 [Mesoplasma corruscae]